MKEFFCCKEMELFLNDPRDPIEYNPVFREYFIRLNNFSNIITFAYCPWCGDKLPTSLRESYFDILKKEHNIKTNLGEYKQRSDIPPEFRTDEWWKTWKTTIYLDIIGNNQLTINKNDKKGYALELLTTLNLKNNERQDTWI